MKKFVIVGLAAILASGCAVQPQKMTTDELCKEFGRSQAAGDESQIAIMEELKTRNGDLGRCKMYYGLGVRQYQDGKALMQRGIQMMNEG